MRLPWFNGHNRYRNDLSAYVDGELRGADARRLETHLDSCDACRSELDDLRLTVLAMRDMPEQSAPRSFALTPDQMSEAPQPAPAGVAYSPALNTGMRLAAGALAVALAVVVFVDAGDVGRNGDEVAPVHVAEDAGPAADEYSEDDLVGERMPLPYRATAGDADEPVPAQTARPGTLAPDTDAEPPPETAPDVPEDRQSEGPIADAANGDREQIDPTFDGREQGELEPQDRASQDDAAAPEVTTAVDEGSGPGALLIAQIGLAAALVMVLGALFVLSRMRAGGRA